VTAAGAAGLGLAAPLFLARKANSVSTFRGTPRNSPQV